MLPYLYLSVGAIPLSNSLKLLRALLFVSLLVSVSAPVGPNVETGNPLEPVDYRDPILFDLPAPHSHRAPNKEVLEWINSNLGYLDERLAKDPNEVYLRIDKAHLLQCKGNLKDAISQCEMANTRKKTGFGLFRHASIEFDLGHWQRTVDDATEALALSPDNKEVLALRLAANTRLNKNIEAMQDELCILHLLKDDIRKRKAAINDLMPWAKTGAGMCRLGWGSSYTGGVNSYYFVSQFDWFVWERRKRAVK